jgi:hypothetical protein
MSLAKGKGQSKGSEGTVGGADADMMGSWQRTLNGGIILIDEMVLGHLNGQAGFADTTSTNNHHLVLSQELRRQ